LLAQDATKHPAPVGVPYLYIRRPSYGLRPMEGIFTGNRCFFYGAFPTLKKRPSTARRGQNRYCPAKGEVNLLVLVDLDIDGFQASVGLFDTERDNVAFGQISKSTGPNVRKMDKNALGFAVAIRFVAVGKPPPAGLPFSFCFPKCYDACHGCTSSNRTRVAWGSPRSVVSYSTCCPLTGTHTSSASLRRWL
jgi:hypothetical protein